MSSPQTPYIKDSEQIVLNKSFDPAFDVLAFENLEFDGATMQRTGSKNVAKKITIGTNVYYIATAPIGTSQSSAAWQVKKITISGNDITITWADGNANFDNIATNLAGLSYS